MKQLSKRNFGKGVIKQGGSEQSEIDELYLYVAR